MASEFSNNWTQEDSDQESEEINRDEYNFYDQNLASSSAFDPFQTDPIMTSGKLKIKKQESKESFKAELMTIRIDDAQKSTDGSYITYRIFTMTCLESYSTDNRPVRRRFRDFLWLHNALSIEYPTCVIPPLPEKHRIKYMKGDRFDPTFIEHRRLGLQWFMDRIARHPLLQASQYTRIFLESTDFKSDKQIQNKINNNNNNHSMFGSLFKTFVKVKKPDEKFIDMKENIDKFEDNLNIIEKLYSRIRKRQQELEQNYNLFANSIRGLSGLETNVDQPLRQFAEATEIYTDLLKESRQKQDLLFLNDVHELLNYCQATKEQLLTRDKKQVEFEDMSQTLQSVTLERERILYPYNSNPANNNANISEFITDKMNDGKAKNERIFRLDQKMKELQDMVAKANDNNNSYSNQMLKEYEIFKRARQSELKQGLTAYADCHIEFYKKSISVWENILPVLDQIHPQNEE